MNRSTASPPESAHGLAEIQPLPADDAGRALTLGWKLFLNASLLLMPMLMIGLLIPLIPLAAWFGIRQALTVAASGLVIVLIAQVAWAGNYPEWPMNQILLRRLHRTCKQRQTDDWTHTARMVEWVPRENWQTTKLDSAQDVMLIRVTDSGIDLEGDFARYHFPGESIIDVEIESIRPSGCFHRLHFVVVIARTADGPIEFPLAYRDYSWGNLRSQRRLDQTRLLADSIRTIATGGDWTYAESHQFDDPHATPPPPMNSSKNPYAAPRAV